MNAPLRVGLLWHAFGHANLGIDALTRAHAGILKGIARGIGRDVRFVTLGSVGPEDTLPAGVEAGEHLSLRQALRGRSQFIAAVRRCDVVFDIGEGDSFTDLYGTARFIRQMMTKIAVLHGGVPLVLAPQTIGPFDNPLCRLLAGQVLRRADAVFARDRLSAEYAQGLSGRAVSEVTDLAFALDCRPATRGFGRIGVNVSGLLWNGLLRVGCDYRTLMLGTIAALAQRGEVHLIAHVNGQVGADTDEKVADELAGQFPQTVRAPRFADAVAAKSYIAGMDFMVAARMHAAIAALSSGVPVVPLAYSRKVNGLFDSLNYGGFVDLRVTPERDALATILDAFARQKELAALAATANERARSWLDQYRQAIQSILARAAAPEERVHEPA